MRAASILLILVTAAIANLAQAQTGPSTKPQSQVLVDFRIDRKFTPLKLTPATRRSVLSKLFRRYLTDESKCNRDFEGNGDDHLKSARDAGQIVPDITDMVTGSFTAAGQSQTLYVVAVNECNASHAENYGTKRVAIFSGQQLVANVDVDFKNTIVRKTDLNGDGRDELLMSVGDMHQGVVDEVAGLLEFPNGRLRVIQDLGAVLEDACPSEMKGSTATAAVVSVATAAPGKMPRLRVDRYEGGCGKNRRWKLVKR
ncbi:MAG TPA: hypothetical protein VN643_06970 [Pyrinomonadaceae bacterium]|nr:hypothetical protein [Pyrinomonadaceae bacterium]